MTAHPIRLLALALAAAMILAIAFGAFSRAHAKGFDWFFAHVKPSGLCHGREIAASFYWQGKRTATGAVFDASGNTAASRGRRNGGYDIGERLTLRNPRNGRVVTVTVNDSGPYGPAHRLGVKLDLALGAAQRLGMTATQWLCVE